MVFEKAGKAVYRAPKDLIVSDHLVWEQRIRWHQGDLLYEGTRRGAVFTVALPPFSGW